MPSNLDADSMVNNPRAIELHRSAGSDEDTDYGDEVDSKDKEIIDEEELDTEARSMIEKLKSTF
jgi:hypothetical protein